MAPIGVKLLGVATRVESGLVASLAGAALALSAYAMAGRYVAPSLTLGWVPEIVVFAIIWSVFLGAARLIAVDGHIRIDLLLRHLPPGVRRWCDVAALTLALGVVLLLVWSGVLVIEEAMRWGERTASSLRLPLWLYYGCLPVGAALMAVRLLARLLGRGGGKLGPGHHPPV